MLPAAGWMLRRCISLASVGLKRSATSSVGVLRHSHHYHHHHVSNSSVLVRSYSISKESATIDSDLSKAGDLLQQQQFDEAYDLFASSLKSAQENGDKEREITSLQGLSVAAMGQGDYPRSVSYYEQLIEKTEGDYARNCEAHLGLGALHVQGAYVEKALITLNKGLAQTKDVKRDPQIKKVQRDLAWAFINTAAQFSKFNEIRNFMSNIKYITRKEKDYNFEIDAYMRAANKSGPNTAIAREFVDEIIALVKQYPFAGLQREHWQALMLLATRYLAAKDSKNAESYFRQALELAKSTNDSERILNSMQGLGTVFLPNRVKEAIPVYQEIIEFCKQRENITGEIEATLNLAMYFAQAKDFTSSKEHLDRVIRMAKQHNKPEQELLAKAFLAVQKLESDPTDTKEVKAMLPLARPLQNKQALKLCLSALTFVSHQQSQWSDLVELSKELLPLQNGEFREQVKTMGYLQKAYKELGQEDKAKTVLEDTLFSGANIEQIQQVLGQMPQQNKMKK